MIFLLSNKIENPHMYISLIYINTFIGRTIIFHIIKLYLKGNRAVCLCPSTLRSLDLWEGAGQVL